MPILIPIKENKFIVFLLFAIKPKHSMVAVTMEKVNASECQVDFDSLITMPEALPENPACREDSQANFVRASITVQLPKILFH